MPAIGPAATTQPFHMAASDYLPHVAMRLAWRLWWLLLPPLAAIAYGAAADWRWAIVGLIGIFIIFPMVMSLAVIRYAASPLILRRAATAAAAIDRTDGTVTLLDAEGHATETHPWPPYPATSRGRLVVPLGPAPDDILLIPLAALNPTEPLSTGI